MLPSEPASSISTRELNIFRLAFQSVGASWRAMMIERLHRAGVTGYLALSAAGPILQITLAVLIYGAARPALVRYAVVGVAAYGFLFNSLYFVGEILDGERFKGTLAGLFLAPCPRLSWLTGFALVGLTETFFSAIVAILTGMVLYGVRFDPNFPALALSFGLYLASLWGLGFIVSALGLVLKKSNDLSNLLSPILLLLGGIYYPVALLPDWLRYPARGVPLGYGTQAMASSALYHASVSQLASDLLPLAGFALALPCAGVLTFKWLERRIRERGELELY